MNRKKLVLLLLIVQAVTAHAQTTADDDIWKEIALNEVDYKQSRNYCQRIYGYYRYVDDGIYLVKEREYKLYNVYEGIFEMDIRYGKEVDDGANVIVGRNLVHPEKPGKFMNFYELKPYTFLEKARKQPKHYTLKTTADTTRVYTKRGLAGTIVRDTLNKELRMKYDALAPDTSMNLNFLIVKAHLSNVQADATYWYDDESYNYVPQGQLKRIFFDGRIDANVVGMRQIYNQHTELYVDSVAYFTHDEYKQEKKTTLKQRHERLGYTDADIDRLKQKLGVKPLDPDVLQRMENQRDWDEEYELWKDTDKK